MICGWAGERGAVDGIDVISGTSSMAYGERQGRGVRTGGWSELFSDEGSAYWIAARALNVCSRMSDGRLPEGPLAQLLREHLQLTSDLEVIDVVLNRWQGHRSEIASSVSSEDAPAFGPERNRTPAQQGTGGPIAAGAVGRPPTGRGKEAYQDR